MPGGGLTKPMKLSPELADVVGKKEASRAECIKQLWAYIKKNNLQDPENKQFFKPDKKMAKVGDLGKWGGDSETNLFPFFSFRSLARTRSVPSAWPSSSAPIFPKNQPNCTMTTLHNSAREIVLCKRSIKKHTNIEKKVELFTVQTKGKTNNFDNGLTLY